MQFTIGEVIAACAVIGTACGSIITIRVQMASIETKMAQMKGEILERMVADRETMRSWINGSFLRAAVVDERHRDILRRLDELPCERGVVCEIAKRAA